MEVTQAIRERRSVRAFKAAPVPKETVEEVLELAINAPSANNLQPWEFVVVAGEERERLGRRLLKAYRERQISCGAGAVKPLPSVYRQRGIATSESMKPYVEEAGLSTATFVDEGSSNFYGAPVAIIICLDDCFPERRMLDVGACVAYLVLAAHALSLATCPIGLIAAYEDEIKDLLNIPENKRVIIGVALGYGDPASPVSRFRTSRDDLTKMVRWV